MMRIMPISMCLNWLHDPCQPHFSQATVGFTVYWCVVAAYLWSAGDINPHLRGPAEGGTAGPSLNVSVLLSV